MPLGSLSSLRPRFRLGRRPRLVVLHALYFAIFLSADVIHGFSAEVSQDATDCDRLAAHPNDPQAVSPGVPFENVKARAAEAVAACRLVVKNSPDNLRYQYQLARALEASGQLDDAAKLYLSVASQGYTFAMVKVSWMFLDGGDGIERNNDEALKWARRAAESNQGVALDGLGYVLESLGDSGAEAASFYLRAAESGYRYSFYTVGYYYEFGKQLPRDQGKAAKWYQRSVDEANEPLAMIHLAFLYQSGLGVEENKERGLALLVNAARTEPKFNLNLADEYLSGRFGPKDPEKAVIALESAANTGSLEAARRLGVLFGEGIYVAKDDLASIKWYQKAADAGDKPSIKILFSIYADNASEHFDPARAADLKLKDVSENTANSIPFWDQQVTDFVASRLAELGILRNGVSLKEALNSYAKGQAKR